MLQTMSGNTITYISMMNMHNKDQLCVLHWNTEKCVSIQWTQKGERTHKEMVTLGSLVTKAN